MGKVSIIDRRDSKAIGKIVDIVSQLGVTLDEVCAEAIAIAKAEDATVQFTFNGVPMSVKASSTVEELVDGHFIDSAARYMDYRASPDYVAGEVSDLECQRDCQEEVNKLFSQINSLTDSHSWLTWFYNVYLVIKKSQLPLILNNRQLKIKSYLIHAGTDSHANAILSRLKAFIQADEFAQGMEILNQEIKHYLNTPKA